jgi:hypothetical protein
VYISKGFYFINKTNIIRKFNYIKQDFYKALNGNDPKHILRDRKKAVRVTNMSQSAC